MHFTIDAENNIQAHDAAPEDLDGVFTTAAQLGAALSDRDLVAVWNSFAGVAPFSELKAVKKFTSRAIGIDRIWRAIQRLADPPEATTAAVRAPRAAADAKKPAGKKKGVLESARAKKAAREARRPRAKAAAAEGKESKQDIIRRLIGRKDGATIDELMQATGWLTHSVRGAIATLHTKGGLKIESSKNAQGVRVYQGA